MSVYVFTPPKLVIAEDFLLGLEDEDDYWMFSARNLLVEKANQILTEVNLQLDGLPIRFAPWGGMMDGHCRLGLNQLNTRLWQTTYSLTEFAINGIAPKAPSPIETELMQLWPRIAEEFEASFKPLDDTLLCMAVSEALQKKFQTGQGYLELVEKLADTIKKAHNHPEAQMVADDLISKAR